MTSRFLCACLQTALNVPALLAMSLCCVGMGASKSPILFVGCFLLFFACASTSQIALFTEFNELFRSHPRCGQFAGWLSSAGSVGRIIGPLWTIAAYNALGRQSPNSSATMVNVTAYHAGRPVWMLNGLGGLLGAAALLISCSTPPRACKRKGSTSTFAWSVRWWCCTSIVVACYWAACTFVSPQIVIANRPPHNYKEPTDDGGGYCYTLPYYTLPCDSYFGRFKPPWWSNPTHVQGAPKTTTLITVRCIYTQFPLPCHAAAFSLHPFDLC